MRSGERVVEIGAGDGALTLALAARGLDVLAVEIDPAMAGRLRRRLEQAAPRTGPGRVRLVCGDFARLALPETPFRVVSSVPYGRTTDVLHHLLDDPSLPLERADLIVQWEVARKRAAVPPTTLNSTAWAPWWEFRLGPRVPAHAFRPVPSVDSGVLLVSRRPEPLLPPSMASGFAAFIQEQWPFPAGSGSGKPGRSKRRRHPKRGSSRRAYD